MNFKQWLFTEEIWQNKTATVYHRTKPENISTILSTGWETAGGCMYGCGLYTTFSIESQFTSYMERYGTSILKFKVTNLDQYIICQKSVAQQILGQNYKISDQLKKLNLTDLYTPEQIEKFDQMMETEKFSAGLALKMYHENNRLENKAKGIIYYGSNDGYCLVKYPPVEDNTITMLGYANNVPTNDLAKMKELETNCKKNEQGKCENPWITSTSKVSIKTLYGIEKEKKPAYANRNLEIEDVSEEEIINLMRYTDNKYLMAKRLGPKNLSKLSYNYKLNLLLGTNSEEEKKKLLRYIGTDFLSKINYYDIDIDWLIYKKQKLLLKFILKNNISKLNPDDITKMLKNEVFTAEELAEMYYGQGEKIDGGILEAILSYSKNLENTLNLFGGKENISKTTILKLLINKTPKEVQNVFGPIEIDIDDDSDTLNFVSMNTKHLKEFLEFLGPKMPEDINMFLRPNITAYDSMQVYLKYKKIGNEEINDLFSGVSGGYIEDEIKENIHEILRALLDHHGGCLPSEQMEKFARVYDNKLKLIKLLFEKCPQQAEGEFIHYIIGSRYSTGSHNNDEILKFVFTKLKDIKPIQVYQFLLVSSDIKAIADLLGEENMDKINTNSVFALLNHAQNFGRATPEEIAEVLGAERIQKLSDENVQELLNSRNGKKIKRILQQYGRIPSE